MKPIIFAIVILTFCAACETVIDVPLTPSPTQISVEATITDQPGPQQIRLSLTQGYLDNTPDKPALGAEIGMLDDSNRLYRFFDGDNNGTYIWQPDSGRTTLGRMGGTYRLGIRYNDEEYVSQSKMNRVSAVDSLIFRKEKINPLSSTEGYQAEFFARDFVGARDYYRVRYFINGKVQTRPQDLITVQDAAFRGSADTDGLLFIRPIRQSINPDSLHKANDVVRVQIESLTPEAYLFLQALDLQSGNGGLFATPPANLPTNIINRRTGGPAATGFFTASAVRSKTATVAEPNLRPSL